MKLKITGMTCTHCSKAVLDALQAVAGATEVSVDLESGFANVKGEARLEQLLAAVREEGYQVEACS